MKLSAKNAARAASLVGIMAATIECAKLALASLPNVEAVTLLVAVYSYTFGSLGLLATLIFVLIEPLIWGFGSWFVSYLIYWPLVAAVFCVLGKKGLGGRLITTAVAVILTFSFGFLSSLVDLGLFSGYFDNFLQRFIIYYSRGIVFYITQIITNAVLFPLLFKPLKDFLTKLKGRFHGQKTDKKEG